MKKDFRIAIPIEHGAEKFVSMEVDEPTSGALGAMTKEAEKGNVYSALYNLVRTCTDKIVSESGKEVKRGSELNEILEKMPYRSNDQAVMNILLATGQDGGAEGVYPCPMCGELFIASDENDTLDYIDILPVIELPEGADGTFAVTLSEMVSVNGHGDVMDLRFRYPTIKDCMNAFKKVGGKDSSRLQYAIFKESLVEVDGQLVDRVWKNRFADYLFTHFKSAKRDLNAISAEDEKYGINYNVSRICTNCGKEWESKVDTSNFFASALPSR